METNQNILKENFSDKEFCMSQLREAREIFGNRNTTKEQYEAMERVLSFAFLYCPEEIQFMVEATLNEAELRKIYFLTSVWK
jgi:hypothetical protein